MKTPEKALSNTDDSLSTLHQSESDKTFEDSFFDGNGPPETSVEASLGEKISQTETKLDKKPRRRKPVQEEAQTGTGSTNAQSEPPHKRATVRLKQKIISIDDARSVETAEDRSQNDLLDLLESRKTGRLLSGTIQGVERSPDNSARILAILYRGEYKILIPAEEAIEPPKDYRGKAPEDVHHYLLTKRLGAEVDYIIKGIDPTEKLAVASRLEAMKAKRRQYYYGHDRNGNELLYPGICAEARVVSVIRAGIFVELFGLEAYIPLRELSYQRMMDASDDFRSGQRILVKLLEIDRSDRDNIHVSASVKQVSENPYEKALRRYLVDNRYVGTVSVVDTHGVFVSLDGGIDCLCSYPKRGRPPRGARVTVRILGINYETNRIWGAITHIAVPR